MSFWRYRPIPHGLAGMWHVVKCIDLLHGDRMAHSRICVCYSYGSALRICRALNNAMDRAARVDAMVDGLNKLPKGNPLARRRIRLHHQSTAPPELSTEAS